MLKALFVLKIFKFLSWLFGHIEKRLSWRHNVVIKQLQYTYCLISHELKVMKFGQLIEYNKGNIFP